MRILADGILTYKMMNIKSTVTLHNGLQMPIFGLGVFLSKEGPEVENAVRFALDAGYIHIDTAAIYGNERGVGKAIRESGIPRDQVFITSKVWNSDQGYESTLNAFEKSLARLETGYLDLYLIHWPKVSCRLKHGKLWKKFTHQEGPGHRCKQLPGTSP
jgi:methylglyoxal/glyoxal reductase